MNKLVQEKLNFFIYKITNNINKKIYIGKTSGEIPEKRFYHHKKNAFCKSAKNDCPKLYRSIRKYGPENFSFEILSQLDSEEEAYLLEIKLILSHNSIKNGLNTVPGGKGAMSGSLNPMYGKGYLIAGERNGMFGMSGELNPFYRKNHNPEFIEKIKTQNRILSNQEIYDIKLMVNNKINYRIISEKFNISIATISKIKRGKRYGDIYPELNINNIQHLKEEQVEEILHLWFKEPKIINGRVNSCQFYNKYIKDKYLISQNKLRSILNGNTWKNTYQKIKSFYEKIR